VADFGEGRERNLKEVGVACGVSRYRIRGGGAVNAE
jgi:hypothetical protein